MDNNLIFLSAQPHDPYFQWQIEVQIVNFRKFNISDKMHICVWYPKHSKHIPGWMKIQEKYPEVNIYIYEDQGVNLGLYISQLRPHILKMHFADKADLLEGKQFFYHDSDIIFNYLPDFEKLMSDDVVWQSDTSSYLDYNYLLRKEEQGKIPNNEAIQKMAEIGGISIETIKEYAGRTGGAQMLLKGVDSSFWEDIERMVLEIRRSFLHGQPNSINSRYFSSENEGFQSWCADMWAINFALWKRGIKTDITPDLDFSWATDSYETYLKKPIFHNAGVTSSSKGLFYKGAWINKNPILHDIPLPDEKTASHVYVKAIKEVNNI